MAADLRKKGLQGLTTGTTYDAWTPARAYSHYHGGVRILSETASARLASPITVKAEELRGGRGVNPQKDDANNGPAWKGGEWRLRDITNYMTATAFSLLTHAADNRQKWLTNFYEIGKEAVRPRREGEIHAYVLPSQNDKSWGEPIRGFFYSDYKARQGYLIDLLKRADVEVEIVKPFEFGKRQFPVGTAVIKTDQPYAAFAKAILEEQEYPDLKDESGNPIAPYDVTAHTLSYLMNLEVVSVSSPLPPLERHSSGFAGTGTCSNPPTYSIYRSEVPS